MTTAVELPFQQYFEAMPCYLSVQDCDLKIITANRRFRDHFGEFEGRQCFQVYKNRSEKCEVCPVERTFHDGQCHDSEERVTALDGTDVSVIVYTTPIRDESGRIIAVMEMSTDITEIKRLQEQLRDSQKRYRQLFESVPCFLSIQDRDLRIIEANRLHREAFGSSFGRKCYEIYKHRTEECIACTVRDTFLDGAVHLHEEVVTSRQGERMNVMVYTAPVLNAKGEVESVIEMSANITQIRELQSQLTSIGMLISTISHGIKGVLTGLDGGVYLVNTGLKKDDRARMQQGWEMVQRNIDRIRSMVFDLLYYAKDRELELQTADPCGIADDVCRLFVDKGRRSGIELKKSFAEHVGTFEVDSRAVHSMLVNLMENAFDACRTDRAKSAHEVGLDVYRENEDVVFRISDNGIGMDRETKENVFSLFFSSKGAEGTGLGLFIASKIAMKHGGKIDIDSTPGRGTCFMVSIPTRPRNRVPADPAPLPPA